MFHISNLNWSGMVGGVKCVCTYVINMKMIIVWERKVYSNGIVSWRTPWHISIMASFNDAITIETTDRMYVGLLWITCFAGWFLKIFKQADMIALMTLNMMLQFLDSFVTCRNVSKYNLVSFFVMPQLFSLASRDTCI